MFAQAARWIEANPELTWIWCQEQLRRPEPDGTHPFRAALTAVLQAGQQIGQVRSSRPSAALALDLEGILFSHVAAWYHGGAVRSLMDSLGPAIDTYLTGALIPEPAETGRLSVQNEVVLNWCEAAVAGAPVAGGKGWNLGRLHRYGYPVPAGGVISAVLYRTFMDSPELRLLWQPLATVLAQDTADPAVAKRLAILQEAIRRQPLPLAATERIQAFLLDNGLSTTPVAVRSSATAEDGVNASFAGIHESFLNRCGADQVVQAIKECYASLWSQRAVAYRRRLAIPDEEVLCGVVICTMLGGPEGSPPLAAGVGFSCDPLTGRRDQVVISAAPGLGDAVVSGAVNPEEITLTTTPGGMSVSGRTGRAGQVLTDEQALILGRLISRVYFTLGDGQDPQDVEWAYDGTAFWLLQSRPVTRLPRRTFPEVAHLPVIWSNANVKDAIPLPLTALSWGLLQSLLQHILFAPLALTGYTVPKGLETVRRFGGRAYLDMTSFFWASYDALGVSPREMNRQAGGYQPEIPVPAGHPLKGTRGTARNLGRVRLLRAGLRLPRTLPADIRRVREQAGHVRSVALAHLSDTELLALYRRIWATNLDFGRRFHLVNNNFAMWHTFLVGLLTRVAPGGAHSMASGLMSGSGLVTSAEHGYRLFDLAATVQQDAAAAQYLAQSPLDPGGWQELPDSSPFKTVLRDYLAEFGHRAVYEAELAHPRWREDPSYLLEQVGALVAAGQTVRPVQAAIATRAAAESAVARRTLFLRPLIKLLAKKSREATALREAAKSAVAQAAEPLRLIALEAGRRMAAVKALSTAADIFHLSWLDVEAYLNGEWNGTGASAVAADRSVALQTWQSETPPDVYIHDTEGRPAAMPQTSGEDQVAAGLSRLPAESVSASTIALTGVGVATGRAAGPARIIRHPSEGHRLRPGDVLVAPSTDPAWTPLFLRASAVVMEVGGYLSHGAIVAREYGIPAVVNIPGLLGLIQEGQHLVVDGEHGQILIDKSAHAHPVVQEKRE